MGSCLPCKAQIEKNQNRVKMTIVYRCHWWPMARWFSPHSTRQPQWLNPAAYSARYQSNSEFRNARALPCESRAPEGWHLFHHAQMLKGRKLKWKGLKTPQTTCGGRPEVAWDKSGPIFGATPPYLLECDRTVPMPSQAPCSRKGDD